MGQRGYAKGRAKRAEILDSAAAVFGEAGYRGASLREIAARCGISHPGLLHHFSTKEALLLAVLERREEIDSAEIDSAEIDALGVTSVGELRQVVDLLARNATQPGIVELFCVLAAEATSPEHPAHFYFADRYRAVRDRLARTYRAVQVEGLLRPGVAPEVAARELVALMEGLQVQWLYDPETVDMAGIVREHVSRQLSVPL